MGNELSTEEWKSEKKRKKAQMTAMQALPYEIKVKRAELRAREFVEKLDDMGLEAHVTDWPKPCGHPDYDGETCIAESRKYATGGDWAKCPYLDLN